MIHQGVYAMARKRVNTRGYASWLEREGLPVYTGYSIDDVNKLQLAPWPGWADRGVREAGWHRRADGPLRTRDPTRPDHRAGAAPVRGSDLRPLGAGPRRILAGNTGRIHLDWQAGSIFASPLNTWHRYTNTSDREPTRYMAVTNAPVLMNISRDAQFLFQNDYLFENRFSGRYDWSDSFFSNDPSEVDTEYLDGEAVEHNYETNFVRDVRAMPLEDMPEAIAAARGCGSASYSWRTTRCSLLPTSTSPARTPRATATWAATTW